MPLAGVLPAKAKRASASWFDKLTMTPNRGLTFATRPSRWTVRGWATARFADPRGE